jgi:STE24 endopeptidase
MDVREDARAHDRRATLQKAAVAGVLAAVWIGAALLLWPTRVPGDLRLPDLDPAAFFPAAHLVRAEQFASVVLAIFCATLAVELVVLGLCVRKARPIAARLAPVTRGRVRTGVAMGFVCIAAVWLATLPLAAVGHWWGRRYDLTHQGYGGWLWDSLAGLAFRGVLYGVAIAGAVWLAGRFGRRWWIVASPILVGLSVVFILAQPLVVQPLFNHYKPLEDPRLEAEVERLADRMGVDIQTVEVADASRRTTVANASVAGIGPTRRVVFDDTILDGRFTDAELVSVAAHELAHIQRRHLWKGLVWFALLAVPGLFVVAWTTERRGGLRDPALVPLGLLVALLFYLATLPVQNAVSRRYEAEADWIALEETRDPAAFVGLERRLALSSLGDPDTPAWANFFLATHPTTMQRIAMGEAYRARR